MTEFASRFMRRPDLFPGRIAGEAWGEEEVTLALPPGRYRLTGLNRAQRASVLERFPTRVAETSADDFVVRLLPMAEEEFSHFDTAGWAYSMDFDHRMDRVRMAGVGFVGLMELRQAVQHASGFRVLSAALWSSEGDSLSAGVLENFLRVVLSYRLLSIGGVMLHSAAVARGQNAFVFVGHSGAGKSTVAQLSSDRGLSVLSDDINALVPEPRSDQDEATTGARFVVDQVPFAGDFGAERLQEGRFDLAGFYRLEQADKHALEPLSKPQALALLVANAPFVNSDEHRLDALVDVLTGLVSGLPGHRLLFRRDADFWDLLA